jgi:hypothetical protein
MTTTCLSSLHAPSAAGVSRPAAGRTEPASNYALDERSHPRIGSAPLMTRMPELLLIEALRLDRC